MQDHSVMCEPGKSASSQACCCVAKHKQLAISEASSRVLHVCTGDSTSGIALQTSITGTLTHSEQVTRADSLLALKPAVINWPYRSADDTADLLRLMFPDSTVCKDVTVGNA